MHDVISPYYKQECLQVKYPLQTGWFDLQQIMRNVHCFDELPPRCLNAFNHLRTKFFRGNKNIYLHFVSFLHIDASQVVEILPQIRQEPTYST